MKKFITLSMLLVVCVLAACGQTPNVEDVNVEKVLDDVELASKYCEENGGTVSSEEGTADVCLFVDGTSCETVDYYNNECESTDSELKNENIDGDENGIQEDSGEEINDENPSIVGLANPASVYCEENGGTLQIVQGEDGEYGMCNFANGSSCEEWEYFRGECAEAVNE